MMVEVYKASEDILHVRHRQSIDIGENIENVNVIIYIRISPHTDLPLSDGEGKGGVLVNENECDCELPNRNILHKNLEIKAKTS